MATWDEIRCHLRDRYLLDGEGTEWCRLSWRFGSSKRERRVQRQLVRFVDRLGQGWIHILCDIGAKDELPYRLALELGADLAAGSVTLLRDRYYVSHRVLLDGLTTSAFDTTLGVVAGEACALAGRFRGMDESAPFHHYGE